MPVRFGVSPIAWVNDDMPELGGETPLSKILEDARDIGFSGVELGGKFPRDPVTLQALLRTYDLDLIGGWFSGSLLRHNVAAEIAAVHAHLTLLKSMGSMVFIYAETSNAIHGSRHTPLAHTPCLDRSGWRIFGERLTLLAEYIRGEGLRFAYHHHLGTVVERPEDLACFFAYTGEVVGLTVDTGHAALGGIDAVATIRAHPKRVSHVHCKDVRAHVFSEVRKQGQSFLDGVQAGMFTVPGDGQLDYRAMMGALADIGYSGWLVVEAEQDPALADPRKYAEIGLRYLRREAVAAGLLEAV
jgi:inosose dehydratase